MKFYLEMVSFVLNSDLNIIQDGLSLVDHLPVGFFAFPMTIDEILHIFDQVVSKNGLGSMSLEMLLIPVLILSNSLFDQFVLVFDHELVIFKNVLKLDQIVSLDGAIWNLIQSLRR